MNNLTQNIIFSSIFFIFRLILPISALQKNSKIEREKNQLGTCAGAMKLYPNARATFRLPIYNKIFGLVKQQNLTAQNGSRLYRAQNSLFRVTVFPSIKCQN